MPLYLPTPRSEAQILAGVKAWSMDTAAMNTVAPTQGTGRIQVMRLPWTRSDTVSAIWTRVGTAGATLTAAQNLACLYDGAGNKIAGTTTADQAVAWTTAGAKQMAVGPTLIPADPLGYLWVAILTVGTTPPLFVGGASASSQQLGAAAAPFRAGLLAATAQTALPATIALTTMTAFQAAGVVLT